MRQVSPRKPNACKKKKIVLYCVSWTVKHGKVNFSFLGFVYICCSYNTK